MSPAGSELAETEFNGAHQLPDEDVLQYHARCRELFDRAYPTQESEGDGLAARNLRKIFVWGLSNRRVSDYVWDQRPRTYDLCLELAQNKLSALDIAKNRKLPSSGSRLQAMNRGNPGRGNDGDKGEKKATVRCWICGESDHIMRDCPQKMTEKQMAPIRRGRGRGAAASRATTAARGGSAGGRTSTRGKPSRGRGGRGGRRLAAIDAEGEEDNAGSEDEYSGNEEGSAL
jgi:hypothetical protein